MRSCEHRFVCVDDYAIVNWILKTNFSFVFYKTASFAHFHCFCRVWEYCTCLPQYKGSTWTSLTHTHHKKRMLIENWSWSAECVWFAKQLKWDDLSHYHRHYHQKNVLVFLEKHITFSRCELNATEWSGYFVWSSVSLPIQMFTFHIQLIDFSTKICQIHSSSQAFSILFHFSEK